MKEKKNPFLGIDKLGSKYTKVTSQERKYFDSALEAAKYYNSNEEEYDWGSLPHEYSEKPNTKKGR